MPVNRSNDAIEPHLHMNKSATKKTELLHYTNEAYQKCKGEEEHEEVKDLKDRTSKL